MNKLNVLLLVAALAMVTVAAAEPIKPGELETPGWGVKYQENGVIVYIHNYNDTVFKGEGTVDFPDGVETFNFSIDPMGSFEKEIVHPGWYPNPGNLTLSVDGNVYVFNIHKPDIGVISTFSMPNVAQEDDGQIIVFVKDLDGNPVIATISYWNTADQMWYNHPNHSELRIAMRDSANVTKIRVYAPGYFTMEREIETPVYPPRTYFMFLVPLDYIPPPPNPWGFMENCWLR